MRLANIRSLSLLPLLALGLMLGLGRAIYAQDVPPAPPGGPCEQIDSPRWGLIECLKDHPGTFELNVYEWPESNMLGFLPFWQIVRCQTMEPKPRLLDIEVDSKADVNIVILPEDLRPKDVKDKQPLFQLRAIVAMDTGQRPDGIWCFTAKQAIIHGDHAKLESQHGNHRIGFWTSTEDTVEWKFKATRWGMYRVTLTYANASPAGSEVTVTVGEKSLPVKLKSTGNWYQYTSLDLGQVYLPTAGDKTIRVECTKLVGDAVMNLKAVILEPDFEGPLPIQAEDGSITLYCGSARIDGTVLRYEPAEKKRTVGYWTQKDAAIWRFTVKEPGEFEVEVLQGCGKGQGGSDMLIRLGDQKLSFTVEDTGHFQNFKARQVGHVKISKPGEYELRVQPKQIAKAAACDIRQIRLLPVP